MDRPVIIDTMTSRVREVFTALVNTGKVRKNKDFFEPLGIPNSLASCILTDKKHHRPFPNDKVPLLIEKWDVNKHYLQNGELPMFNSETFITNTANNNYLKSITPYQKPYENAKYLGPIDFDTDEPFIEISPGRWQMTVKMIPEYAYAGYPSGYRDPEYFEDMPKHTIVYTGQRLPKGKYLAFEVSGDSMDNGNFKESCPDGIIVTGREIGRHLWKSKLHIHKWPNWIFVHKTEGIILKQIIKQDVEKGILTLHSLNPDKEKYPDFDVKMDDLEQIFNVVKRDLP